MTRPVAVPEQAMPDWLRDLVAAAARRGDGRR